MANGDESDGSSEIGTPVKKLFEEFAKETEELKLEIEPGTFLLAHACGL